MKKWLIGFALVAVAVGILVFVYQVFGNQATVRQIWNAANAWIGNTFGAGDGIQLN